MQYKIRIVLGFLFVFIFTVNAQDIRSVGTENGLSNNQAYSVIQDTKGFIWVSTKQGIDRFDGARVVNYTLPIKLMANSHIKVCVDNKKIFGHIHLMVIFFIGHMQTTNSSITKKYQPPS